MKNVTINETDQENQSKLKCINYDRRPWLKNSFLVAGKAFPMALSYTFSIEQVVAGLLALNVDHKKSDAAAIILFQTVMALAIRVPLAPLFAVSIRASSEFGELKKINPTELQKEYEEKQKEITTILKAGLIESVIVSIPAFFVLFFSEDILKALGQSPEVAKLASTFLRPFSISSIALAIRMSLGQIMFANGDPNPAMYIGVVTFAIGTTLAKFFSTYKNISLSNFAAIAWGYNIESYLTPMAYALYLFTNRKYAFLNRSKSSLRGIWKELCKLNEIGIPVTITMIAETILTFMMSVFAGLIGVKEQAALSYAMQMPFFVFLILMAFGQATGLAVNRFKGEEKFDQASKMAKHGLIVTTLIAIPIAISVICAPEPLYELLHVDHEDRKLVSKIIPIVLTGASIQAARYNINQTLRNLNDNKGSTLISILGMSVGIIISGSLGLETSAGLFVIAGGLALGELASFIGLMPRWWNRTEPERIKSVYKDPLNAEPKSWCEYLGSLFKWGCRGKEKDGASNSLLRNDISIPNYSNNI